jgi:aspartyl-tRNA(Asn)/glutamyl-tRNA(Gln) amidotransferase subunit A
VVALEAEGAIVVGKANADEFAWGVAGQNPHYGDVVNPLQPDRIAGGSSGGNAAALAAGLVPLALGTDTGGSVRLPAAACGIVGLKPALGTISTEGVFPLAPSFDTVGPMATTVEDCALAHSVLTGTPVPPAHLEGVRVGVLARPPDVTGAAAAGERDPRADVVAGRLRDAGAEVRDTALAVPAGDTWPVFYAEAAVSHSSTFPSRRDEYGPTIRAKLDQAASVTVEEELEARETLTAWRAEAAAELDVDVVASPTLGLAELPSTGVDELEIRLPFSAYTRVFSYLGWPAVSIGGLQLAGPDPNTLIAAALAFGHGSALRLDASER